MSGAAAPAPAARRTPRQSLSVVARDRNDLVDLSAVTALCLIAGVGFHTSFGGWLFMLPVVVATLSGLAIGHVSAALRLPAVVTAAVAVVTFFVIGGLVCVTSDTMLGIPTGRSVQSMVDGAVRGWALLLTIIPPSGQEGNLLAVPFITVFVAAILASYTARRFAAVGSPVLFPAVALAVAVLWGTDRPAALLLQGCGFLLVAVIWMSMRSNRRTAAATDLSGRRRLLFAGALLAITAVAAPSVSSALPFVGSDRYVLRDRIETPPDPATFASPLARFPWFVAPERAEFVLVRLELDEPLPEGVPIRFAAMDGYDGLVFSVTGGTDLSSGLFVKTGSTLPATPAGDPVLATFTIEALTGVWLPLVGEPVDITVEGDDDRARTLRTDLRFNRSTRALIVPGGTATDDRYRITTVLAEPPNEATLRSLPVEPGRTSLPMPPGAPTWIGSLAREIVDETGAETPYEQAVAITRTLRDSGGARNDLPGTHSLYRLSLFLDLFRDDRAAGLEGTPEQYAASAALLLRSIGIPSRVVVGFVPEPGGTEYVLTGSDIAAWVEVPLSGQGWVRFDPTPDSTERPTSIQRGEPQEVESVPPEPPPASPPPPPDPVPADEELDRDDDEEDEEVDEEVAADEERPVVLLAAAGAASVPIGFLLLTALIVAIKALRRQRRRRRGSPTRRISSAWTELVDAARDHGFVVPRTATRIEVSRLVSLPATAAAASSADSALFGDAEVNVSSADSVWSFTDEALRELRSTQGLAGRLRAALSLQSFRRRRSR